MRSSTASSSSSASTSAFAIPQSNASCALMRRPVSTTSAARVRPISPGSRCEPPAPGMIPSVISGRPNCAFEVMIRKSQPSATSQPIPNANPSTTAIVGCGSRSSIVGVNTAASAARQVALRQARPALEHRDVGTRHEAAAPSPRSTTTRTSSAEGRCRMTSRSSSDIFSLNAFSVSGRENVMRATPPSSSYLIVSND